jgi:hypothetical protein
MVGMCASALIFSCGKKKKEDEAPAAGADVKPGALMTTLDTAVDSALTDDDTELAGFDADEECKSSGTPTEANSSALDYEEIWWKCQFMKVPNGPDTVRGGLQRAKQLVCSLDKHMAAGEFAINGTEYTVDMVLDEECWGESFAEMVAEEYPDLVNEDGFVVAETKVTGYPKALIPEGMTDSDDWNAAFEFEFGLSDDETVNYKMLFTESDDVVAASILSEEEDAYPEVFAVSLTFDGDDATLRYEGRFPNAGEGEMSQNENYGSRHVKAMSQGEYAGEGAFKTYDMAAGFSMEISNSATGGEGPITSYSYRVKTFFSDADVDFATVKYEGSGASDLTVGSPDEYPTGSADDMPEELEFTASEAQMLGFIHDQSTDEYTQSDDWHKANGPLDFELPELGD